MATIPAQACARVTPGGRTARRPGHGLHSPSSKILACTSRARCAPACDPERVLPAACSKPHGSLRCRTCFASTPPCCRPLGWLRLPCHWRWCWPGSTWCSLRSRFQAAAARCVAHRDAVLRPQLPGSWRDKAVLNERGHRTPGPHTNSNKALMAWRNWLTRPAGPQQSPGATASPRAAEAEAQEPAIYNRVSWESDDSRDGSPGAPRALCRPRSSPMRQSPAPGRIAPPLLRGRSPALLCRQGGAAQAARGPRPSPHQGGACGGPPGPR